MNMEIIGTPEMQEQDKLDWFKQRNLDMLRGELKGRYYPGYPHKLLDINSGARLVQIGLGSHLELPIGRWDTGTFPNTPDNEETRDFVSRKLRVDTYGRPLHPWIDELLQPDIGVVTGRGRYWHWGPNYTADPIIIRRDSDEPKVLMITRRDNGRLALPGGHVENQDSALDTAIREAQEEAFIDISRVVGREIYRGPLSDSRMTAHAWPETTAYVFDLPDYIAQSLPDELYDAGDDAATAEWLTYDQIQERVIGPHKLLVELAFQNI